MSKTNIQLQAEMAERKKMAGQKRVGLWLDLEITERGKLLKGMTQTDTLTHAIRLGLQIMELIKEHDSNLYVGLVDGDLSGIQSKIKDSFFPELPTQPTQHNKEQE